MSLTSHDGKPATLFDIMPTVDHVFVINLDHNPDRLDHMFNKLDSSDLRYTPRSRIPSRDATREDFSAYMSERAQHELAELLVDKTRKYATQLTRRTLGRYMSHLDVWQLVAAMPDTNAHVLILEDDAIIPMDINARLRTAWVKALYTKHGSKPLPFVIVWAAGQYVVGPSDANEMVQAVEPMPEQIVAGLGTPQHFFGMQAYSLTPKTAATLVSRAMHFMPIDTELETALVQAHTQKLLRVFVCPRLALSASAVPLHAEELPLPLRRLMQKPGKVPPNVLDAASSSASASSASSLAVLATVLPIVLVIVLLTMVLCMYFAYTPAK
jgi:GR25 family glycosyltransferase involved in LPS biosynthesis